MNYVVYYRVSSKQQGRSGLGLEAQRTAVDAFLASNKAEEIPPSFTEIESGQRNDRPELRKAINRCKERGATLLIVKLDRLARNVAFIFALKEELERANVGFRALDLPEANTMTLAVMAGMAQQERELISQRTKAALREKKRQGVKLGSPQNLTPEARERARQSIMRHAREDTTVKHAYHFIRPLREQGMSYHKISEELNREQYYTRTGRQFHAQQVWNIYKRFETQNN